MISRSIPPEHSRTILGTWCNLTLLRKCPPTARRLTINRCVTRNRNHCVTRGPGQSLYRWFFLPQSAANIDNNNNNSTAADSPHPKTRAVPFGEGKWNARTYGSNYVASEKLIDEWHNRGPHRYPATHCAILGDPGVPSNQGFLPLVLPVLTQFLFSASCAANDARDVVVSQCTIIGANFLMELETAVVAVTTPGGAARGSKLMIPPHR
ncbi:hypothetical protein ZHAS_00004118 [Anopheles sinensis]|uniref:Uncharacterized protein n=1 Tax=Anopheles sinensis TaxID=74873 RepID=A0A084VFZ0_ANOSI|nr:hypothetical protein ZHAS_00004118 [Anopheles sinensis]